MIAELTTHLWQSTLFAAAAALLTLAFRNNRAKVRFWLWLSASLKFFIPFALLMNLGSRIEWTPATQKIATQIATPAVSFAVEIVADPFPVTATPAAPHSIDWTPVLLIGLWACGLLAITLIRLRLWLRVRAAVRASTPLQIPAAVGIRSAPGLLEPGVVGLLTPVLLLPEGIVDRLTPSQLQAVLAHELCHVRRRDNLFASIHMIVEAVFWFHPLVWWIGARLVEERERACDEDVLSLGSQPRVYADAILSVCKLYVESPLVCVSGVTGSDIKQRIEAIMNEQSGQALNRAKKVLLATAGFAALAIPVMIGVVIGIGHLPAIQAQSPVAIPPTPPVMAQAPVPSLAPAASTPAIPATSAAPALPANGEHRLVAMLFDFSAMSYDDQAQARDSGIRFVQNDLKPGDLVCVMQAGVGPLQVRQDFTADPASIRAAIQGLSAAAPVDSAGATDARLSIIETAAKMLAGFPEKKSLMYYSTGITQSGVENQAHLKAVMHAAVQANVAIYPIDARGAIAGAAAASGAGRGAQVVPAPEGLSQEEYNRRVAEAQQKFGATNAAMSRTYIRYGPPDQIDSTNTRPPGQVWRYNYLPNFHSSVEFEFTPGKSGNALGMKINYPLPIEYSGTPAVDTTLAEALNGENQGRGPAPPATNVTAGLPVRHTSIGVYPVGEQTRLSVPLDSLSGTIDILAQVRTRPVAGTADRVVGSLRDTVTLAGTSQSGMYQAEFMFDAGSYICRVLVREASTGRVFTETINFDVK